MMTAPTVQPPMSDALGGSDAALRAGRAARITFAAEDPDDDPLTYTAAPLPQGATFDEQRGVLTWRPTREQEGRHELTLVATDGRLSATRTFVIVVRPNRAPMVTAEPVFFRTAREPSTGGEPAGGLSSLLAQDPDLDDITFETRRLPPGAHLVASASSLNFVWAPTDADVGEHEIVVVVSDGELQGTIRRTVVVIPEWEEQTYVRWLLLGGGPSAFLVHSDGEGFVGGTLDITVVAIREDGMSSYSCAHGLHAYDCHASHHRFYGQFEVLDSMRSGAPGLFTYGVGYSASFEWNPARRYLIPHYGIDAGGLVRSGVGHLAQVHPYLGLHLWASNGVWIDASLGYRVTPAELLDLSGPTLALRAILNPW
jgi:hypothetical protein